MKRIRKFKSSLLLRYGVHLSLVFFLPFFVLATITYQTSIKRVDERFQDLATSELSQVQVAMEEQLRGMRNIALHIQTNEALSLFMMDHPFHGRQGREILASYIAGQDSISAVILHFLSEEQKYFSSIGSMSLEALHTSFFENSLIDEKGVQTLFQRNSAMLTAVPNARKGFQLTYFVPLLTGQTPFGGVLFDINNDNLNRILPPLDAKSLNQIFIIDNQGQLLLTNVETPDTVFVDANGFINQELLEKQKITIDGNEYHILTSTAQQDGLTFISIIETQTLTSALLETDIFVLGAVTFLLVLGIILVAFISYRQYQPIKKIYSSLDDVTQNEGDELKKIEHLVTDMVRKNKSLVTENRHLQRIDNSQVILDMLEEREEELKNHPFISNLKDRGMEYYIVLMKRDQLSAYSLERIFSIQKDTYEAYIFQIPLQNKIGILILHLKNDIEVIDLLKDLRMQLGMGEEVLFYCGRTYKALENIKHSYIEAMIACGYLSNEENNGVISYKTDATLSKTFLNYPEDLEEKLLYGIKQGTYDVASDTLKEFFDYFHENSQFEDEIKLYSYFLIRRIIDAAIEIGLQHEQLSLKRLMEFRDLQDLEEHLLKLLKIMTEHAYTKRDIIRHQMHEEVFKTIRENYTSPDLSLEFLSEKHDYSVSYLSKVIKEEMGMTFTKYIQDLRMKHIKAKLVETDLPIKDIINQAGYYDVSNFSRTFKKKLGVTPGQYRELNRSNANENNDS